MMLMLAGLIVIGLIPLYQGLRSVRRTTLVHSAYWALAAWLSWGLALLFGSPEEPALDVGRYCALCLTGCAGVAVLGARRPIAGAWNFVVLGLFAVMVLPLVETLFLGTHPYDGLRIFFMGATVAVGMLNYLPTRLGPCAVLLLAACAGELALLYQPQWFAGQGEALWLHGLLLATPWVGWLCFLARSEPEAQFDRLWLSFRDRWGVFWAQRVREQFNQAARHAGWPVKLTWRGLVLALVPGDEPPTAEQQEEMVRTLRATLQRFFE
jgi:hypothetical protein